MNGFYGKLSLCDLWGVIARRREYNVVTNSCVDRGNFYGDQQNLVRIHRLVRANPLSHSSDLSPLRKRAGFTLVEIMAVMMVIAILLSVAAVGIQNIKGGQATTASLAKTEAFFDLARSEAAGKGIRTRVIIQKELRDNNNEDRADYLRKMYLLRESTNEEGEAQGAGGEQDQESLTLEAGVYLSPEESEKVAQSIGVGELGTMSFMLRKKDKDGSRPMKEFYYVEFNPEGVCVDSEDAGLVPGAAIVLISGTLLPGEEEPKLMKNNKVGFVVWRNGRTSIFRSPEQIDLAQ